MAIDPITAKILAKLAAQAVTDEQTRKRLLIIILGPVIFLLMLIALILYLISSPFSALSGWLVGDELGAIDVSKSYTNVEYYHYDTFFKTVRNSLSVSKSYHDASTTFPMTQPGDLLAKKGATFLYVNTVNNSIPLLETAFSFSYGNRRFAGIPSVSFPGGLSISFDGYTINMGTYTIRLKSNGQVLF